MDLSAFLQDKPLLFYLALVGVLLVSPAALAVLWRTLLNAGPLQGRVPSTAPTGWDAFFERGESCLVLFHMKNGEKIGGLFGDRSDASTYPNIQQVYVEENPGDLGTVRDHVASNRCLREYTDG